MGGSASDSSSTDQVAAYNAANTPSTGESSGRDMSAPDTPTESPTSVSPDSSGQVEGTSVAAAAVAGAATGASVGGGYGAIAGAVIGAGISIYGQLKSAEDQAALDEKKKKIAEEQANEIFVREQINETIRNQATFQAQLQVGSEYAASGKEGAGIGSQLEVKRQADLATALARRDASYQEHMLLEGGSLQGQLADITRQSSYFNAAGTGINLGTRLSQTNMGTTGPSNSQSLPQQPEGL